MSCVIASEFELAIAFITHMIFKFIFYIADIDINWNIDGDININWLIIHLRILLDLLVNN